MRPLLGGPGGLEQLSSPAPVLESREQGGPPPLPDTAPQCTRARCMVHNLHVHVFLVCLTSHCAHTLLCA